MPIYDLVLATSTFAFVALGWFYLRSPGASIFNPATYYLAFHGMVFVIRPIFARVYDFRSIYASVGFVPSLETKINTIVAANVAMVVFVGLCVALCPPLEFHQEEEERDRRGRMMARYLPAFIGLSGLCLWALIWMWGFRESGGRLGEVDLRTGVQGLTNVSGYFISLTGFMVALGGIFAYLNRFRWWSFLPLLVFSVLRLGVGSRGEFIVACIVLGLLFLFDRRRKWPSAALLALVLPVYLTFSAVVSDRGAALREALTGEAQPEIVYYSETELSPLEHMDFGNLEFLEYVVHVVPERSGTYDYFLHNLQLFTEPIPRGLWKDKPFGAPIQPVELYRYGKPIGMTMSVAGVGWYSLGYIGVVLWSAFFGLVYASAYRAFVRSRQTVLAAIAYSLFLGTCIVAFRDGLVLTILKQFLFFAIPVIALWATERLLGSPRMAGNRVFGMGAPVPEPVSSPAERRAALARQAESPPG